MKESLHGNAGIVRVVKRYKAFFRVPENLNFYSKKDFVAAERKFLKYAISNGGFEGSRTDHSSGPP